MSDAHFNQYYYEHGCGQPYTRNEAWLAFFGAVAERVVAGIQPKSVLDAGCAMGFLVEALLDRGVAAFGVDISDYAIGQVREDIRPYVWVGSLTDILPRRYDLIVCIEVLEHMPASEAERAIAVLCAASDDILFSSTPMDYYEATHFNVQQPEVWGELFARQGFFRDVDFDGTFLTPWAVRYRKQAVPVARIVRDYERRFWQLWKENADLRRLANDTRTEYSTLSAEKDAVQANQLKLQTQVETLHEEVASIRESRTWRLASQLWRWRQRVAPSGSVLARLLRLS